MEQMGKSLLPRPAQTEKSFIFFFLWTSLVPLILLFLAGYYTTANLLQKQAYEKQTALAGKKHDELALFVEKIKGETASWSTDGLIREMAEEIHNGACDRSKTISVCPASLELSAYLSNIKIPLDPAVGIIDILNVSGFVVASSDIARLGINESEQKTSFNEAKLLALGEATFFPELVSEEEEFDGRMMIHLTAPIPALDNSAVVGVLLAHTENSELNKIISENIGQTTESYIVNKWKFMVTPSRFTPDAVLKQVVSTPPVRDCVDHGMSFTGTYRDYRGIEVFGASVCDPKLFGTLIVETDKSEVFIEINRLRNTATAILIVALLLILGYAYLSGADIIRGARHIFPSTFSSATILGIVVTIIIIAVLGISTVFTKNIERFILDQKTSIISSLVTQQANRHINRSPVNAFAAWGSPESQKRFQDFSDEILHSFQSVVAVQLHATNGMLVWSSLQNVEIGTSPEAAEVSEVLKTGRVTSGASTTTKSEVGAETLLGLYVPILSETGEIVGIAETYVNTGDIAIFTKNIKNTLWAGSFIATVFIFLLLRYAFRKQDARIVAQSEELSGLINQSPIGIYTVTKNGFIETYNPAMAREVGVSDPNQIIGKNVFELEYFQKSGLDNLIREGLKGEAFKKDVEVTLPADITKKFYHYYYGVPLKNADGEVDHLLLMSEDITERKELEKKVRDYTKGLEERVTERTRYIEEEKAKAVALLASLGEGMIATNNAGEIITINRMGEQMLKLHEAEIIGKKMVEVVPAETEDGALIPPGKRACLTAAEKDNTEIRSGKMYFVGRDGMRVPVAVTATPVIINGENTGAVVIFRDITAENEIEKTRRDLLALASHQLRTPLSGTKWLIETLKKGIHGTLTTNQEEYLNEIYKINERMTTLVHDMLGVLRMEGDTSLPKRENASLSSIFDMLLETLAGTAKSKNIKITIEKSDVKSMETDPILLRSILEGLLSNAINYSPTGSEVVVGTKMEGSEIVFSVRDNGIGIPREEQRQIFERFYRASNAKTYDTHGTGLGLYITSTLAKKIGAQVTFESEVGKGSTFYVRIPLVD